MIQTPQLFLFIWLNCWIMQVWWARPRNGSTFKRLQPGWTNMSDLTKQLSEPLTFRSQMFSSQAHQGYASLCRGWPPSFHWHKLQPTIGELHVLFMRGNNKTGTSSHPQNGLGHTGSVLRRTRHKKRRNMGKCLNTWYFEELTLPCHGVMERPICARYCDNLLVGNQRY